MRLRALVAHAVALAAICGTSQARADEPQPVFIWYRSGGECPDGAAFLNQLDGKVDGARIAVAGDPIDFVVTLGSLGKHSNGRLERETNQGKVAIREIDSEDCAQVAEALALSLVLAIDPTEKPSATAEKPPQTEPLPPSQGPAPPPARAPSADPRLDRAEAAKERSRWSIGVQGMVASAIAPALLPGANAFVDVQLSDASLRLGAFGMLGSVRTDVGDVRYRLLGGRLEGCPLRVGSDVLSARPCAAFDLGQLRVEGAASDTARADTGVWAAANLLARVSWQATRSLAFELQAGAFAPFTRYTLRIGDPAVDGNRTASLGFSAGLGASAQLP